MFNPIWSQGTWQSIPESAADWHIEEYQGHAEHAISIRGQSGASGAIGGFQLRIDFENPIPLDWSVDWETDGSWLVVNASCQKGFQFSADRKSIYVHLIRVDESYVEGSGYLGQLHFEIPAESYFPACKFGGGMVLIDNIDAG